MKRIFLILLLLSVVISYSQKTFYGHVIDSNNNRISHATVFIKQVDIILTYKISDEKGFFILTLDTTNLLSKENISLCASHIGYSESCITLFKIQDTSFTLKLYPKNVPLNTVIVTTRINPIKISGDTTKYAITHFTNGTEEKLEDILKKLPGILVDESGSITFNGKKIDKILVEGDDFFSKNYKLLTKSITASSIETVDAIENHDDEDLLSSFRRGNQTILNIGIKKNLKLKIFGDVSIAIGSQKDWLLSANLLSIKRKTKIGLIGNFNTIGEDINPEMEKLLQLNDLIPKSAFQGNTFDLPIKKFIPSSINTSSTKDIFSTPKIIAFQCNEKIGHRISLKTSVTLKENTLERTKSNIQIYQNSNFSLYDSSYQTTNPNNFRHEIDFEYKIDTMSKLKFYGLTFFNFTNLTSNNTTSISSNIFNSRFFQSDSINNYFHKISYIKKLNKITAFEVSYSTFHNKVFQKLISESNRYFDFLGLSNTNSAPQQLFQFKNLNDYVNATLYKRIKNNNFSLGYNYLTNNNKLGSELGYIESQTHQYYKLDSLLFLNQLYEKTKFSWLELKDEIKKKNYFINYTLTKLHYNYTIGDSINHVEYNNLQNKVLQSFIFGAKLKNTSKLGFSFKTYFQFNNLTDFGQGYIQNDLYSFVRSKNNVYSIFMNDYAITYLYNNFFNKGLILNTSFVYSKKYTSQFSKFKVENNITTATKEIIYQPVNKTLFTLNLDKYINSIKSTLKLQFVHSNDINYDNIGFNDFLYNKVNLKYYEIGVKTGFKTFFNFYTTLGVTKNKVNTFSSNEYTINSLYSNTTSFKQTLFLNINTNIFAYFLFENFSQNYNNKITSMNFSEFKISYKTKHRKIAYSAWGRNMLNTNKVITNSITPQFSSTETKNMLFREFFVSFKLTF